MKRLYSGVYIITCIPENKHYIGKSVDVFGRLAEHKSLLLNGRHKNVHLTESFNKYGFDSFSFDVLEYCDRIYIASFENWWCNMLNTHNREYGYNIQPTNPYSEMLSQSPETKKRISDAGIGRVFSQERNDKISKKLRGREFSQEWRENISASKKNIKVSDSTRNKLSLAHKGKVVSIETREKLRKNALGNTNTKGKKDPNNPNRKGNKNAKGQGAFFLGKKHKPESIAKMIESRTGQKRTEEQKRNMSFLSSSKQAAKLGVSLEEYELKYKGRLKRLKNGVRAKDAKKIVQIDITTGEFIKIFESGRAAAREYGSGSYAAANKKRNHAKGFLWAWLNNLNDVEITNRKISIRPK